MLILLYNKTYYLDCVVFINELPHPIVEVFHLLFEFTEGKLCKLLYILFKVIQFVPLSEFRVNRGLPYGTQVR